MEALATFAALSFTGRTAPESTLPAERGERSGRHERRRDDGGGDCCRHERRADDDAMVLSLKAQVQAVFSGTASTGAADSDDAGGLVDAELKARLRFEGPQGRVDLKLEIELDDASRDTFDAALSGFTETLYAALRSLYGGDRQGTPLPAPTPSPTPAPSPASPPPPAPAAVQSTTPVTAEAPAPAVVPTETPVDPAPQPVATEAAGSVRVDLRLRLRYSSFEDSMGGLVQRLAQPDAARNGAVEPGLFDDLVQRFDELQRAANGRDDERLNDRGNDRTGASPFESLGSFLAALAERFRQPAPAAEVLPPVEETPAAPPAATLLRFSAYAAFSGEMRAAPLALAA